MPSPFLKTAIFLIGSLVFLTDQCHAQASYWGDTEKDLSVDPPPDTALGNYTLGPVEQNHGDLWSIPPQISKQKSNLIIGSLPTLQGIPQPNTLQFFASDGITPIIGIDLNTLKVTINPKLKSDKAAAEFWLSVERLSVLCPNLTKTP